MGRRQGEKQLGQTRSLLRGGRNGFREPGSLTIPDPGHSQVEERFILLGKSQLGNLLVVPHTERGDNIRIISARKAGRKERRHYEASSRQGS